MLQPIFEAYPGRSGVFMAWHHHTSLTNFIIQQSLRSASSHQLSVPRTRLSTYGDRAFPVVDVRIWNSHCSRSVHQQSSAAYHICSVTSCLLFSPEDILLRTVPRNDCCRAREVTCHLSTR